MSRVVVLSFSALRSDPRVRKQLELLTPDHEVITIGHGEAPDGVADHLEVPAEYQGWQYPRQLVVSRQYWQAYAGNPAVAFVRERVESGWLGRGAVAGVVANDVEAAGIGLWLEPRGGLHLDLHEFAPEQNAELWRFRTFVAPFLRWQLRTFATRAASTTTVCDAIAQRYAAEFGLAPGVVMNASAFREVAVSPAGPTIHLVHAGAALRNRQIEAMIQGVGDAVRFGAPVSFDVHLMPNDPAYVAELEDLASDSPGVRVLPPLPHDGMVAAMAKADVGVHMLAPTNYNNAVALPNKLFDFVQARLGIIVGPSPEMARIVTEHGLGRVTADFTSGALTEALLGLTPAQVDAWKAGSDAAAWPLSAQEQVGVWREAFARLLD